MYRLATNFPQGFLRRDNQIYCWPHSESGWREKEKGRLDNLGGKGKREAGRKETDRQDRWMEKPVVTSFLA